MLPPHELKNKTFSRVLRGYNSVEVDEHINFIIEKYTELYRENDDLERKLKLAEAQLSEFRADEESIRSALVNAQKASSKIINEANERADVIIRSAKTNCNKILSDFRKELHKERGELHVLAKIISEFKARLFTQYQQHITYIEEISPDPDFDHGDLAADDDVFVRRVVNQVKNDIITGKVTINHIPDDSEDELVIEPETKPNNNLNLINPAVKEIPRIEPESQPEENSVLQLAEPLDNNIIDIDIDDNNEEDFGGGYLDDDINSGEKIIGDALNQEADDPDEEIISAKQNSNSAQQNNYKNASVKDTIRQLNLKFSPDGNGDENSEKNNNKPEIAPLPRQKSEASKFSYTPDAEDEELLSMIRSVTGAAEEKLAEKEKENPRNNNFNSKNKKKSKSKPLSLTEEFDLVADDDMSDENN